MSRESRSYVSAQRCLSVAALINCAVTRTRLPERCTDPSTIASACSSRAITGSGLFVPYVLHRRTPRDHLHTSHSRQISGQRLSHAVGKVILFGVAGQIL